MAAAAVKEVSDGGKSHVESAVVVSSEHDAYGVLSEETVESVGVLGRREVVVEAGGGKLMVNGDEDGAAVLEDRGADGKKRVGNGRIR